MKDGFGEARTLAPKDDLTKRHLMSFLEIRKIVAVFIFLIQLGKDSTLGFIALASKLRE